MSLFENIAMIITLNVVSWLFYTRFQGEANEG